MPASEANSLSPEEQISELAALFAKGLLRWYMTRHKQPSEESAAVEGTPETDRNPLEFPATSRLSGHSG